MGAMRLDQAVVKRQPLGAAFIGLSPGYDSGALQAFSFVPVPCAVGLGDAEWQAELLETSIASWQATGELHPCLHG